MERPSDPAATREDPAAVAGAVEAAFPGVDVLDRALELDDGARADLAGVDASGRLVLVQLAAEGDRAALDALDLLGLARRCPELFARHLGSARIAPRLEPRVIVILEPGDARLAERLSALVGAGIELYELRTVRSAAGERTHLLPRPDPAAQNAGSADGLSLDRFLEGLAPERQDLGRSLCERLARLDDELRTEVGAHAVAWYFQDRLLVRLEARGARLRGAVGPRGELREIGSDRAADELLEEALSRLVDEVGQGRADQGSGAARNEPIALLTTEELEAFRS